MLAKSPTKARRNIVIAILLLIVPVAFLTAALYYVADFRSRAAVVNPQRVIVGNLASNSAVVSWVTPGGNSVAGVEWGETTALGKIEVDYRNKIEGKSTSRETHYVQLDNLQPNKEYYYRIKTTEGSFPAEGETPYSFKTLPLKTQNSAQTVSIYGQISGDASADTVVVAYVSSAGNESLPLITYPRQDGSWYLNLAQATPKTGTTPLVVTEKNSVTLLFDGGENGDVIKTRAEDAPVNVTLSADFSPEEVYDLLADNKSLPTQTPTQIITPTITITPSTSISGTPIIAASVTPTTAPVKLSGNIDFSSLRQDVTLKTGNAPQSTLGEKADTQQEDIQLSLYSTPTLTNVTDSNVSMFWITKTKETTQLVYGTNQATTSEKVFDDRDGSGSPKEYFIHHVTLKKLSSNAQYSYVFGKSTATSSFTVPLALQLQPAFQNISGKVTGSTGECIMKTQLKRGDLKSSPVSTLVTPDVSWLLNVGPVRSADLKTYFAASATDEIIFETICVQGQDAFKNGTVTTTVNKAITEGIIITLK